MLETRPRGRHSSRLSLIDVAYIKSVSKALTTAKSRATLDPTLKAVAPGGSHCRFTTVTIAHLRLDRGGRDEVSLRSPASFDPQSAVRDHQLAVGPRLFQSSIVDHRSGGRRALSLPGLQSRPKARKERCVQTWNVLSNHTHPRIRFLRGTTLFFENRQGG